MSAHAVRPGQGAIHYSSGLKVEVEPADADNITAEVNALTNGQRVANNGSAAAGCCRSRIR